MSDSIYILINKGLNVREILSEKFFDTFAVMAPGLWEDDHFVVCNGVLVGHKAKIKPWIKQISSISVHSPPQIVERSFSES